MSTGPACYPNDSGSAKGEPCRLPGGTSGSGIPVVSQRHGPRDDTRTHLQKMLAQLPLIRGTGAETSGSSCHPAIIRNSNDETTDLHRVIWKREALCGRDSRLP